MKFSLGITILLLFLSLTSCKKFLTIDAPDNALVSESVFSNARTTAAVLQHAYIQFHQNFCSSGFTLTQFFALYADEYRLAGNNNTLLNMIYTNSPEAANTTMANL